MQTRVDLHLHSYASNVTSYYPCVSEDSKWVVFNQSNCAGNPNATDVNYNGSAGYGTGVCDGYDDSSAKLYLVDTAGTMREGRPGLTRLDLAVEVAAGYARAVLEAGDRVGLITFDGRIVGEVNMPTAYRAWESAHLDFRRADAVPDALLNDILWHAIKGKNAPMPPVRHSLQLRPGGAIDR